MVLAVGSVRDWTETEFGDSATRGWRSTISVMIKSEIGRTILSSMTLP
jgi:hypothetical protein